MGKRSQRNTVARGTPEIPARATPSQASDDRRSRKKLWAFRLLALFGGPVVFVGLLELILRLAGYGYPTTFLLPATAEGRAVYVPNNQFGWRFFGRELARWPYPFAIPKSKATNTVRIFVFGESAARGEPQPDFGLPRVLEALLSLRHPGVRFEVVNTAMTAINSHAIGPIARDCASADGDLWVIYMGNNEVVGPFGAGTVFGAQIPPLPLIRASLAARATRTGQGFDALLGRMPQTPREESTWGGMTMFLEQQVRADDARMTRVYQHFERNLAAIVRVSQRANAGLVVSTVAVNLKDSPPFASAHQPGWSAADQTAWDGFYSQGIAAQERGDHEAAAKHFATAARLDGSFAELRFRQGQCALALGDQESARRHFQAARDEDTLRFRCDTRMNELIRRTVANHANERVLLADAERVFAEQSPAGLPGEELFYEHVHLTFAGNYQLARTIAEQVEKLLPAWVVRRSVEKQPWPAVEDCARRLARSEWHEAAALNSIIATLNDPPFTGQLDHAARMKRLEAALGKLSAAMQPTGIADALKLCETALTAAPDDAVLHKQMASLKKASGDIVGAAVAVRRQLELLPNDSEGWSFLGAVLAQQQQLDEAAVAFRRAFQLGPQGIKSALDLAGALAALGREEEAIRECQRILKLKPRSVPALLQLGRVVEKAGRRAEAENYFRQALTNRSQRLPELVELGGFFQSRGAFEAAVEVYTDAIKVNPADATLRLAVGRSLASLGRYEEAATHTAEAVRLTPDFVEARLLHGIVLFRRGMTPPAIEQFEAALRLRPESLDARVNLGMALAKQGRRAEALSMFREVLQRNPTNAVALQQLKALAGNGAGQAPKGGQPAERETPR